MSTVDEADKKISLQRVEEKGAHALECPVSVAVIWRRVAIFLFL
ncbi:MAG: hypothetical protein R2865_06465 [Deinococcales bacterium]